MFHKRLYVTNITPRNPIWYTVLLIEAVHPVLITGKHI
jgi:hypothetical protein